VTQVLKAGGLYFVVVFGVGFVLAVTIVAARWTVLRLSVPMMWSSRLAMGGIALVLMLISEFGFVLWIRGLSIKEYFATRDPVSGAAYYLLLIVFAIMPVFISRA
jgi:hypothetical protein